MPWFVMQGGKPRGPLDAAQLKALAANGTVAPDTEVAQSEAGPWVAATRVRGLFDAPAPAAPVSVASAPPPDKQAEKACPFCGETILAVAIKCKHCGEMLDERAAAQSSADPRVREREFRRATTAADANVTYPEIKRTCNKCGKVWFSDSNEEDLLVSQLGLGTMQSLAMGVRQLTVGSGPAGTFFSNDSRQRVASERDHTGDKIDALKRCPDCKSKSYTEIKPPPRSAATDSDDTSDSPQNLILWETTVTDSDSSLTEIAGATKSRALTTVMRRVYLAVSLGIAMLVFGMLLIAYSRLHDIDR